jgi:very-short-patch-repair endonuclease
MKLWMKLPPEQRQTLGIITFNIQQQTLIQDLFDQARRDSQEIEWFFDDARIEPTIVKNLENVQGDERDVMLFSIAFGPDATGKIPLNFGALSRAGGERRLNVAVTRARRELVVYSSFKADQLNADGAKHIGVRHLKAFLDYADRGPIALHAQDQGSVGGFESPFEEAVALQLKSRGWQVVSQIGVSAFRIDLGIVHPDKPGAYLAGIECDGATYHRSATAQDRDRIREQILRHLGWEILRIWSTDWWADSNSATDRLHTALTDLLARKREEDRVQDEQDASRPPEDASSEDEIVIDTAGPAARPQISIAGEPEQTDGDIHLKYRVFDGSGLTIQPDAVFDNDYSDTLKKITLAALEMESPVRDDILCQRIARLHNIGRTTSRLRDRVLGLIPHVAFTDESTGRFLWYPGTPLESTDYRYPDSEEARRPVDQISLAELCDFVISHREILQESDPPLALARMLGIGRLTGTARDRLREVISRTKELTGESDRV